MLNLYKKRYFQYINWKHLFFCFVKSDKLLDIKLIKILQFFKEKKKQIYISTKHSKINAELNIKNWTEPQIRL